jgi:hypothetical protein
MKITMDLLPDQYKAIPRSWTGIYIVIVMILVCAGLHFGLKWYFDRDIKNMQVLGETRVKDKEKALGRVKANINQQNGRLSQVMLKKADIIDINKQIDFFNKIYGKTFSWYEFFDLLEKRTPKNVWIKQIKINPALDVVDQEFELNCEATDPYHAPEFLKNLMLFKQFLGPKGAPDVHLSTVLKTPEGGHEFSLKFRTLPLKDFWLERAGEKRNRKLEHLVLPVGQTLRLVFKCTNIAKSEILFGPSNYLVQLSDENVCIWSQYDETITGRAPGMCEIVFLDLEKRRLLTLPVEVK